MFFIFFLAQTASPPLFLSYHFLTASGSPSAFFLLYFLFSLAQTAKLTSFFRFPFGSILYDLGNFNVLIHLLLIFLHQRASPPLFFSFPPCLRQLHCFRFPINFFYSVQAAPIPPFLLLPVSGSSISFVSILLFSLPQAAPPLSCPSSFSSATENFSLLHFPGLEKLDCLRFPFRLFFSQSCSFAVFISPLLIIFLPQAVFFFFPCLRKRHCPRFFLCPSF